MTPMPRKTLLVLTPESPCPPVHGGRVDVFRRLEALKNYGVDLYLVVWFTPEAGESRESCIEAIGSLAKGVLAFPTVKFKHRPWMVVFYPEWVAKRCLRREDKRTCLQFLSDKKIDAVLVDHLNAAGAMLQLNRALKLKYFYRSHNIEFAYTKKMASFARSAKERFFFFLAMFRLKKFEEKIIGSATAFYDISVDDLRYWEKSGFLNGKWLPPSVSEDSAKRLSDPQGWCPAYDVGYVGNLYSGNNVEGVLWFLHEVVPQLRRTKPDISVLIAGSKPVDAIRKACVMANARLISDPPDIVPAYRDARVLVNPVFASSGMNVKAIEMLFSPAALVATSAGLTGLPKIARVCFQVADDACSFANRVLSKLDEVVAGGYDCQSEARAEARGCFSQDNIMTLVDDLP